VLLLFPILLNVRKNNLYWLNEVIASNTTPIFVKMAEYAHDNVVPYQHSNLNKKEQVSDMFDSISSKYDLLNRLLSGGSDIIWRKKAIRQLKEINPSTLLDVATGTGDVAILAAGILQHCKITGIDISEGMLEIGRQKVTSLGLNDSINLLKGDSEAINFPDASFDSVIVAFGVRNFQHLEVGLAEIHRVLRPGGKAVILEFSKPKNVFIKPFYLFYINIVAPFIGKLFSKNKKAYQYLNKSIQKFPEGKDFLMVLNTVGFRNSNCKPLSFGICSIYCGIK